MRSAFASYLLLFFFLAAAVAANPARAGTTCQNLMVDSAKLLAQSLINCDIAATQSKPCEDPTLAFKTAYDAIKIATPQGCGFLYETHYVIDKWSNIFLPTRDQECTISACKASGDKRRNLRTIDQLFIGEFNRLFSAGCDDTRLSLNATFTKRLTNLSAGKSYRDAVAARQSALLPTIGAICSDIISTATVDASLATITTTSGILNLIDVDNGAIVNAAVHDPQGELIGVTRFTISWGRVDQAGLLDTPNGIPLGDSVFKLPVFREKLLQDAADDELRPILVSLLDANSNLKRVVGPISVRTDIIAPGLPQLVFPSRIALDAAGSIKVVDGLNPPSTFTQDQITLVAKTDALFHGKSSPYLSASASQLRVSVGGTDVGTLPKDISNVGPGGTIQIVIPKSVFGGQKGSLLATAQLIDQASNHGPLVTGTILLDIDKPIVPDLAEPEIKDGGMTCRGLGPIINSDHPVATITAKTVVTGDTLVTSLSGVSNVSPDTRPLALSNDFTLPEINSPKSPATPNAVIKAQTFRGNVGSSIVSKGFFIDTVKPIAPTPNVSCADTTPTSPCDLVFKLQDQDDRITFTTGGLNCSSTGAMATCLKVAANETLDYTVEDWACNQLHSSYTLTPIIASATRVKFTATPTSIPSGSPVTLSAEVTGEGGPGKDPTGLVSFTEGANLLGTAVLDGSSRGSVTAILKGTGDHSITAHYEGDKNNQSSVASAVVTVTLQALSPTQSLLSPSTTSLIEGSTLILTGTVQTASNNGIAPSGTLTFSEGATPLGTSTLDRNQKANISLTNLSAGTHIFIVSYSGDSLYSPSLSPPITVTVTTSRSNTQTLLTASKLNLVSTETLTFNAQVSQSTPNGHLPSGLVTFQGSNGLTNSAALDAQGQANISGIAFTPGTYTITANYPGDTYNQPSTSNTLTLTVTNPQTTSTTSLTAAPATVQQGTPITFTAHVSGNTVVGQFPTGNVSFKEGTITLSNGPLDANQNATFTTNQLTPGTHVITASYLGDASNTGSTSPPVTVAVTTSRSNTQTLLTASKLNLVSTETLTFNAQVSQSTPNGHLPSGLVTFQGSNGLTNSAALDAQGQANISGIAFTPGTYTITANYPGDTYNQPSTSNTLTLTVTNPQTTSTTSLTAAPATVQQGTPITFTAHVSGNTVVGQFPTGNVSFKEGTITLSNGPLDANQNATFTTNQLTPGTHVITASYLGDASNTGSTSPPVTVAVTTSRSNTQTLLTASKLNLVSTETLTFNAQVSQSTPNGHLPSGLVTFQGSNGLTNSAALDAQGQANISGIAFTPGTYTITANYPGDTYNQPSTSNTLTLTVTNPQTTSTTSLTAAPATVLQGTPITFTAHVSGNTVVGQFPTGNVSFKEGTITLSNGPLDANQNATFTTNQLTPGTHVITASYLGDASNVGSSSAPVTVTVTAINSPPSSINLSYTPSGPTSSNTPITVTASVSGFQNTQGPIPTGSATFFDGNTQIQTVPLNNGVPSMQKTFSSGGHSLGASYTSTNGYAPSSTQGIVLIIQ